MTTLFLEDHCAWAPGVETGDDWMNWAEGTGTIDLSVSGPPLEHMSKISKRRLSQLTKMVLEVGHVLLGKHRVGHIIFCSRYGEIRKQYKITQGLLDGEEVRPGDFSHSVFNTPLSLLTIEEKIKDSVNVLLAGDRGLSMALQSSVAQGAWSPDEKQLILFGDELLPEDYAGLLGYNPPPYAFGLVVSFRESSSSQGKFALDEGGMNRSGKSAHPLDFYSWLIGNSRDPFRIESAGALDFVISRS